MPTFGLYFLNVEILRFGMGEYHGGYRSFRLHHESFRQLDADILRLHQLEQRLLVFQIRDKPDNRTIRGCPDNARRSAASSSSPADPGIPRYRASCDERVRQSFRHLQRQRLQGMGAQDNRRFPSTRSASSRMPSPAVTTRKPT